MWARVLAAITSLLLFGLTPTAPALARPGAAPVSSADTAADFEAWFQEKNDWTWSGGDQVTSLRAANGLTYWSFGDTVIGKEDPVTGAYRPGWEFLPNTILVQRGDDWSATTFRNAVPDAADGDRFWTQGMFQAGG